MADRLLRHFYRKMLQVVNIGNTHTEIGEWDEGKFHLRPPLRTDAFQQSDLRPGVPAVAATVVPAVRRKLTATSVIFPELTEFAGGVDFRQIDRQTLGADRVANAIALAHFYQLPGIVIDCGTAITFELVDENRLFLGGAIAPGRTLMRRALHQGTAQLPEIPFSAELPDAPGDNTVDAIRFGIDRGAVGLVRELIQSAAAHFSRKPVILLTGGDAPFFYQAFPGSILAPSDFTLHGIRLWAGF